jgi:hypothetical protein
MELLIPVLGLGGLYIVSNQNRKKKESKESFGSALPNTNIPDRNYPTDSHSPLESDATSELSHNNRFDSVGVYTDKFFNPDVAVNQTSAPLTNKPVDYSQQQFYSMTGEKVDGNYFQHNNQVPFFGSKKRDIHTVSNSYESVLDNMNGTGSQTMKHTEQAPLFAPSKNLQWAHGTPNSSDFMQSRMNVSMKMENVKPFAEQRVAPGLDLGYGTEGAYGYNSGMAAREKWLDRGVDELRVANKPKPGGNMLYGHEGPSNSYIKQMGQQGVQEKNRVDTSFEMGSDRYFTTTGMEKGPALRPIQEDRFTNRPETTTSYTGIAGYADSEQTYVTGDYMPSKNISLGAVPLTVANANGRGFATESDYGIKSQHAYNNNRTASNANSQTYFGILGGIIGEAVAPLLDIVRPTRKENAIGNLRPYQNLGSHVPQTYVFNPSDRAPTTIRETTENSNYHLNMNRSVNQSGGGYLANPQQPVNTNRLLTSDFFYSGNSSASVKQTRAYDAEYNQRNNDNKSSTNVGYKTAGNMAIYNGSINQRTTDKDSDLITKRGVAPSLPYQSPDTRSMGIQTLNPAASNNGVSQIQLDRNNGNVLSQLKGNPYVLDVRGGI